MKSRFSIGIGLAALMLAVTLPATSQASRVDRATFFTLNAPLEVPGHVLVPGSYIFKLPSDQDMNVVQILNKRNNNVVATLFTIPDEAVKIPGRPMLTLSENNKYSPEKIHAWFYPGMKTGWEFVYPHNSRPGRKLAQVLYGEIPSVKSAKR